MTRTGSPIVFFNDFNLETTRIADLMLGGWKRTENTVAIKPKRIFDMCAPGFVELATFIGYGDIFSGFDVASCVDGLPLFLAIPVVVGIRDAAVIDKAYGRLDSSNHRARTTGQCICFDDTAERIFAREVVVEGEKQSMLSLW